MDDWFINCARYVGSPHALLDAESEKQELMDRRSMPLQSRARIRSSKTKGVHAQSEQFRNIYERVDACILPQIPETWFLCAQ